MFKAIVVGFRVFSLPKKIGHKRRSRYLSLRSGETISCTLWYDFPQPIWITSSLRMLFFYNNRKLHLPQGPRAGGDHPKMILGIIGLLCWFSLLFRVTYSSLCSFLYMYYMYLRIYLSIYVLIHLFVYLFRYVSVYFWIYLFYRFIYWIFMHACIYCLFWFIHCHYIYIH